MSLNGGGFALFRLCGSFLGCSMLFQSVLVSNSLLWFANLRETNFMLDFITKWGGIRKIPPWSIPPRWIPTWFRVRVWVRVRLGGIWSVGIHRGEMTRGEFSKYQWDKCYYKVRQLWWITNRGKWCCKVVLFSLQSGAAARKRDNLSYKMGQLIQSRQCSIEHHRYVSIWCKMLKAYNRSSRLEVFCKKIFLEISQHSQENTCARLSFLIKLLASGLQLSNDSFELLSCYGGGHCQDC